MMFEAPPRTRRSVPRRSPRQSPDPRTFPRRPAPAREPAPGEVAAFYLEWLHRFIQRGQRLTRRDLGEILALALGEPSRHATAIRPIVAGIQREGLVSWRAWLPTVELRGASGLAMVEPLQGLLRRAEATVDKHIGAVASRMILFSTARELVLGREQWARDLGLLRGLVEG